MPHPAGRCITASSTTAACANTHWVVAPQTESISVGDLSYDAMRVNRIEDGGDQTILWVARGVPTPIRILQREDGARRTDLRLIEYKGVSQ